MGKVGLRRKESKSLHVDMIILLYGVYTLWNIIPLDWTTCMLYSLPGSKAHWLLNIKLFPIYSYAFPTSRQ